MIDIFPAVDILGGCCVRLAKGDYETVSVYDENPERAAERFLQAGIRRLHVVDLDAAKAGHPVNTAVIADIIATTTDAGASVQVGGGLRDMVAVEQMLSVGASYVILGTAAVRNPDFRHNVINAFAERVILGLDAREEHLAVSGWLESEDVNIFDFLSQLHDLPPAAIIYTDIGRDGMLSGVNRERTRLIAEKSPCPIIASGGVRDMDDLRALAEIDNLAGVIVGRALYTGDITLSEVMANANTA